jgi:hypothetical protein
VAYTNITMMSLIPSLCLRDICIERKSKLLGAGNKFLDTETIDRPPAWSSGQTSWLQTQRSRVLFSALPDFLSSSGSGTGSTQPL